jgi:hypothetical protein
MRAIPVKDRGPRLPVEDHADLREAMPRLLEAFAYGVVTFVLLVCMATVGRSKRRVQVEVLER